MDDANVATEMFGVLLNSYLWCSFLRFFGRAPNLGECQVILRRNGLERKQEDIYLTIGFASSSMSKIYVGRLSEKTREADVVDTFGKFGKIVNINTKPGFGFVVSVFYLFLVNWLQGI
jgi:hypothetical protein